MKLFSLALLPIIALGLVLPFNQIDYTKRELTGKTDYVDVYGCGNKKIDIKSVDDLKNVEYGCRATAMVSLYLNMAQASLDVIGSQLNNKKANKTFTTKWEAYTELIQTQVGSDFGYWIVNGGGKQYYHCVKDPSDFSSCGKDVSYTKGKTAKWSNLYIDPLNIEDAVNSFSKLFGFKHLTTKDFKSYKDSETLTMDVYALGKLQGKNMTLPKLAVESLPNPIAGFNKERLQFIQTLVTEAKLSIGKVNPYDLLDFLKPVAVYQYAARAILVILTQGKKLVNIGDATRDSGANKFQEYLSTLILLLSASYIAMGTEQNTDVGMFIKRGYDHMQRYVSDETFTTPQFNEAVTDMINSIQKYNLLSTTLDIIMNNARYDFPSNTELMMERFPDYLALHGELYGLKLHDTLKTNDTQGFFEEITL